MKISTAAVLDSLPSLTALSKTKLPAKTAFAVALVMKQLKDIKAIFDPILNQLYKKYADKDEAGEILMIDGKFTIRNYAEFVKEYNELMATTHQLDGIKVISISELGEINIEPEVLIALHWLITAG